MKYGPRGVGKYQVSLPKSTKLKLLNAISKLQVRNG